MRGVMASVLVLSLVGCASQPGTDMAKSVDEQSGRARALNIPALGAGIFHCDGPGSASQHHGYPKCDEIPVIVLATGGIGNGCASLLPYNELRVHVGPGKPKTNVTWFILGPNGYKFDPVMGVSFMNPGTTWVDGTDVSSGQKSMYRWSVSLNAPNGYVAAHQAYIVSPTGVKCAPIDPTAVNTDQ